MTTSTIRKRRAVTDRPRLAQMLGRFRGRANLSQGELARDTGLSYNFIGAIERGVRTPSLATLEKLAIRLHLSEAESARLIEALTATGSSAAMAPPLGESLTGDTIPSFGPIYGRKKDLATLQGWLLNDNCRVVGIVGMEGIGKTALVSTLARQVQAHFMVVSWRSLVNKTTPEETLHYWILALQGQLAQKPPVHFDDQLDLLISLLRSRPCLLVLDNLETALEMGAPAGTFSHGFEGYRRIIEQVARIPHESCLLLTSREVPECVAASAGEVAQARMLRLRGISVGSGQQLLEHHQLNGSDIDRQELVRRYGGNPLALNLASNIISELFGADIGRFLTFGEAAVGDVRKLLDRQFSRLTDIEQQVLYWLAIERVAASPERLQADLMPTVSMQEILDALTSLVRRFLLEVPAPARFTLQPVIMEFITKRCVSIICSELDSDAVHAAQGHMNSYALLMAQAADDVRASQTHLLLGPVVAYLQRMYRNTGAITRLMDLLRLLQASRPTSSGYAAGNAINLLVQLQADLRGQDFSGLVLRQTFLRDADLHGANMRETDLSTAMFADTFAGVLSLAFHAYRPLLAAGTMDGKVRVWDTSNWSLILDHGENEAWVGVVGFSPDGRMLAAGSDDGSLRVWDVATWTIAATPAGHDGPVRGLAWQPGGQVLASSGDDGAVRLCDISSLESRVLAQLDARVRALAWKPDGRELAIGSDDGTLQLHDTTRDRSGAVHLPTMGAIRALAFHPTGGRLAVASGDGPVRIWDLSSETAHTIAGSAGRVWSLAFSADGQRLACAYDDHTVRVYDTSHPTSRLHCRLDGHHERVRAIAFRADSGLLATGSDDQTVRLWDPRSGRQRRVIRAQMNGVRAVAFSPDGQTLASGGDETIVHLIDMRGPEGGHMRSKIPGHTGRVTGLAFSWDGRLLASASEDRSVRLNDARTGKANAVVPVANSLRAVAFRPQGQLLACACDDVVRVWDVAEKAWTAPLKGHNGIIRALGYDPAGQVLVSGGDDGTLRLWDAADGHARGVLTDQCFRVRALAISPDGQLVATGSADRVVRLWRMDSGRCVATLRGHADWVRAVAFSPNGQLLASAGDDHMVRLWNVAEQISLHVWGDQNDGHTSRVWSVAFHPSGSIVASGGEDGTIKLWNVNSDCGETTLHSDRPYERMNIAGAVGLTNARRASLLLLGAVEE